MTKIVINSDYGGFCVPDDVTAACGVSWYWEILRDHPALVAYVENGGKGGRLSALKVVEIPDGIEWEICEYDGLEWVAEKHRKWS